MGPYTGKRRFRQARRSSWKTPGSPILYTGSRERYPDSAWRRLPGRACPSGRARARTHFESLNNLKTDLRAAESAHRVRIGALPEHPRMLPSRRRHVHDSGQSCTRGCGFCSVPKGNPRSHECALDSDEPANVARMAAEMKLRYVVITSVNRDDLADGGSTHFAETVREVRQRAAGGARGSADAGFLRRSRCRGARARCRSARLQSQHGDRAAPVSRGCGRRPITGNRSTCCAFARHYRPDVLTKSGFMVGLGETRGRSATQLLRDLRAAGRRCRDHRPVSAADAPQSAGGGVRHAGAIRAYRDYGLSIGFKMVFSGPLVRSSYMADLVNERRNGRVLNLVLALLSAVLLVLLFSAIQSGLARARRAGAAADRAVRAKRRPARRFCSAGLPESCTGSASATGFSSCSRSTATWARAVAWAMFALFCLAKALHMGVFALLAGILHAPMVGHSRGRGAVGGDRRDSRLARLRLAGAWQCRRRHGASHAAGAVHRRLRTLVRVRADVGRRWRSRSCGGRAANSCGSRRCCCCRSCPRCLRRSPARRPRCWCNRTSPNRRNGRRKP